MSFAEKLLTIAENETDICEGLSELIALQESYINEEDDPEISLPILPGEDSELEL